MLLPRVPRGWMTSERGKQRQDIHFRIRPDEFPSHLSRRGTAPLHPWMDRTAPVAAGRVAQPANPSRRAEGKHLTPRFRIKSAGGLMNIDGDMKPLNMELHIVIKNHVSSLNGLNCTIYSPISDLMMASPSPRVFCQSSQIPRFHPTDRNINRAINPLRSSASPTKVTGG